MREPSHQKPKTSEGSSSVDIESLTTYVYGLNRPPMMFCYCYYFILMPDNFSPRHQLDESTFLRVMFSQRTKSRGILPPLLTSIRIQWLGNRSNRLGYCSATLTTTNHSNFIYTGA